MVSQSDGGSTLTTRPSSPLILRAGTRLFLGVRDFAAKISPCSSFFTITSREDRGEGDEEIAEPCVIGVSIVRRSLLDGGSKMSSMSTVCADDSEDRSSSTSGVCPVAAAESGSELNCDGPGKAKLRKAEPFVELRVWRRVGDERACTSLAVSLESRDVRMASQVGIPNICRLLLSIVVV